MPEFYSLIEHELYQAQTMPPSPGKRPTWLHAAVDGEDSAIMTASSYRVDLERGDVPVRVAFDGSTARLYKVPTCPTFELATGATA